MRLIVLCVRDRGADVFGQPTYHMSRGAAIRAFSDEVNRQDPQNMLAKHPEDFDLYELGVYDDSSGTFECHTPKQIAVGKDLVVGKELRRVS